MKFFLLFHYCQVCLELSVFVYTVFVVPHQIFTCPSGEDKEQANDAKIKFAHPGGDHLSLLNVYNAYRQSENHHVKFTQSFTACLPKMHYKGYCITLIMWYQIWARKKVFIVRIENEHSQEYFPYFIICLT